MRRILKDFLRGFVVYISLSSMLFAQGKCQLAGNICLDAAPRIINGVSVNRDCWNWKQTWSCVDPNAADYCNPLKNPQCQIQGQDCLERDAYGECMRYNNNYDCAVDEKKLHGGILPTGITELAPTHLITQNWDTSDCDARTAEFDKCTVLKETCVEGPSTKTINGVDIYRDCWKKQRQYQCNDKKQVDQCKELEDKGCKLKDSSCVSAFPDGSCQIEDRTYTCVTQAASTVQSSNCEDKDFAKAMTNMEVSREIGRYFDKSSETFFKGDPSTCSIKLGGALDGVFGGDCCQNQGSPGSFTDFVVQAGTSEAITYGVESLGSAYTYSILAVDAPAFVTSSISAAEGFTSSFTSGASGGPTLSVFGFGVASQGGKLVVTFDPISCAIAISIMVLQKWLACKNPDIVTVFRRTAGLCHFIGSYCSNKSMGCLEKKQSYCCYISKLARMISEQGKPQLGRTFGTPENPQCDGFYAQDLEKLDFSKMDLSEFYNDIKTRMPTAKSMSDRVNKTAQDKADQAKENYYAQP